MLKTGVQYTWPSDAQFTLNNEQFGVLYNTLSSMVATSSFQQKLEESRQTLGILQLLETMNAVLEQAVNSGIASEVAISSEQVQEQKG